jgi:hypothetical protein
MVKRAVSSSGSVEVWVLVWLLGRIYVERQSENREFRDEPPWRRGTADRPSLLKNSNVEGSQSLKDAASWTRGVKQGIFAGGRYPVPCTLRGGLLLLPA